MLLRFTLLGFAALLIGLSVNYFHPRGVQWSDGGGGREHSTERLTRPSARLAPLHKAEDVLYLLSAMSLDEAKIWVRRETPVVIDARPEAEFKAGHIPGAQSLPFEKAEQWLPEFARTHALQTPILIYCDDDECPLAMDLSVRLFQQDFSNVRYLQGGYDGWHDSGQPNLNGNQEP